MNNNLFAIIKRIVAEQGEGILGDPQRLKSFVSDYAKGEAKEDRVAFGRAIEQGFYLELKRSAPADRPRVKAALVSRLQSVTGFEAARAAAAVDLLEAVIASVSPYGYAAGEQQYPQAAPPPTYQQQYPQAAPPPSYQQPHQEAAPPAWKISRKTVIFGAAAGAGALVGDLIAGALRAEIIFSHALGTHVLEMGFWGAMLSVIIAIALLAAQHILQRKPPNVQALVLPVLLGILSGAAAGGIAQAIFNVTQNISSVVKAVSNALCWGFMGAGLGFGVSLFIPNYPKMRALLAGLLGGTIGGTIYVAMLSSGTNIGSLIGIIVLGCAIGLAISFIEEALREAWLTVIWGPKETVTVSLGAKPVIFGSSREADIFLPYRPGGAPVPPIRAIVAIENGQVIMEDKQTGRRSRLQNGSEFTLDRLRIVVNTKSKAVT